MLVILDGFGYRQHIDYNAIACADTPFLDFALQSFPHTLLNASGSAVGLPDGFVGNSEVGHMTIGTGQIIKQPLTRISEEIKNDGLCKNRILHHSFDSLALSKKTLHCAGILSDGGVHGHIDHLFALIQCAIQAKINQIVIHAFLDGRDVGPQTAEQYLGSLQAIIDSHDTITLGSLHGRFYAMDRDRNWQRTQKSYDVMTKQQPIVFKSWQATLEHYYQQGIFDEYIPPTQLTHKAVIENGDGLIFFDFRQERERQLASAFTQKNFTHFAVIPLSLSFFITPVPYGDEIITTPLITQPVVTHTLKQQLTARNKTILSIAETEKYAHVTYFFDGGSEITYPTEKRILIPSIKTTNYADYPCMSAQEITAQVLLSLKTDPYDFYLINYANADMVGHTGNFDATVKAIECLDKQLKKLYEHLVVTMNGTLYITSDHGKAEDMFDTTINQPRTAHTANQVPFMMLQKNIQPTMSLPLKQLSDISDWILNNINL